MYDVGYTFKAVDQFSPVMAKMSYGMEVMDAQVKKVESRFKSFGNTIERTGKFLRRALLIPLSGLAAYSIKNTLQFEKMGLGLQSVMGSADAAAKMMSTIEQASMKTGLDPGEMIETATSLKAAGYSIDAVNEKMGQLEVLAVGSGHKISEISGPFIRMATTGKVAARSMVMLAKDGIPVWDALQKKYHLSAKQMDLLKTKTLGLKFLEPVIQDMTKEGSAFYETYLKAQQTVGVSIDRIHASARLLSAALGEGIIKTFHLDEKLKDIADRMPEILKNFKDWMDNNPELLKMITYGTLIAAGLILVAGAATTLTWAFATLATTAGPTMLLLVAAAKAYLAIKDVINDPHSISAIPSEVHTMAKQQGWLKTIWAADKGILKGAGLGIDASNLSNVSSSLLAPSQKQSVDVNIGATAPRSIQLMNGSTKVGAFDMTFNSWMKGASTVGI